MLPRTPPMLPRTQSILPRAHCSVHAAWHGPAACNVLKACVGLTCARAVDWRRHGLGEGEGAGAGGSEGEALRFAGSILTSTRLAGSHDE